MIDFDGSIMSVHKKWEQGSTKASMPADRWRLFSIRDSNNIHNYTTSSLASSFNAFNISLLFLVQVQISTLQQIQSLEVSVVDKRKVKTLVFIGVTRLKELIELELAEIYF